MLDVVPGHFYMKRTIKMPDFTECIMCSQKTGSPLLCISCISNRNAIMDLKGYLNHKLPEAWQPIASAPRDATSVDIWCETTQERHTDMRRVDMGSNNIFYKPVKQGVCCVRNATHFLIFSSPKLK